MLAGIGAFVHLDWTRLPLWLAALGPRCARVWRARRLDRRARARGARRLAARLPALAAARLPRARPLGVGRAVASTTRSPRSRSYSPSRQRSRRSTPRSTSPPRRSAGSRSCTSRLSPCCSARSRASGLRRWIDQRYPGRSDGLSSNAHASPALDRSPAGARARDRAARRPACAAAVRFRGGARPPREPIATLPGIERLSISAALEEAREVAALGIGGVMLFGIPAAKDPEGSGAWDEEGVIQTAVRALKGALPELLVLTDVCLCEYTDHGHCGVLREDRHARRRQRRIRRAARARRGQPRPRRRRPGRPLGHDGRPRRRDPLRARRGGLRRHSDPRLLRQVRLRLLRSLSRGRRLDARVRRPPRLSDGPRQRPRGRARGAARRGRRARTW